MRAPRLHRGGAGSSPAVSIVASVVSTASTRPLYGRGVGSTPAGGFSYPQARGVTEAPRAPTSLVRVRILAGLPSHDRRGPERLGYLMGRAALGRCGSTPRIRLHTTTATYVYTCCGPERFRLSTRNRQVAGSSPARSTWCSGSSAGRAVPGCANTTAASTPSHPFIVIH
jgi:hypothetical protein